MYVAATAMGGMCPLMYMYQAHMYIIHTGWDSQQIRNHFRWIQTVASMVCTDTCSFITTAHHSIYHYMYTFTNSISPVPMSPPPLHRSWSHASSCSVPASSQCHRQPLLHSLTELPVRMTMQWEHTWRKMKSSFLRFRFGKQEMVVTGESWQSQTYTVGESTKCLLRHTYMNVTNVQGREPLT